MLINDNYIDGTYPQNLYEPQKISQYMVVYVCILILVFVHSIYNTLIFKQNIL